MLNALRVLSVAALVLISTAPGRAAEKWTRLETEHFVFVGDAPERQIRQIAQRLEQFRDVMSRILPPAAVAAATPTTVFVFQSDRSLTPYKPLFEGRPIEVAGYFVSRGPGSAIALNAGAQEAALRIIFHEYAHFMTANTAGEMPLWANEGLAGFYETFEARDNGRIAMLGLPNEYHLAALQGASLLPLRELMSVDHSSPLYNEGSRRGVFYAESWALMHYLSLGSPARSGQLREYLQQVKNGAGPEPAFKAAFGSDIDGLERELREYARQFTFPGLRLTFNEKVNGSGAGRGAAIDEMEANAYLGELLVLMGRVDDARTRLKALIARNPSSARGVAALGLLELQGDHLDAALPLLERAAALDPANAATHRAWGAALYANSVTQAGDDVAAAAARAKARGPLSRAIELLPGDAELLVMLGHLESAADAHAQATALFERAVSIAPRQERYRLMLADSLVRQQDYTRATSYLGPLLAGSDPDIKETARDLLKFVATQRERAAAFAGPSRPAASSASAPAARPRTAIGGRFVPEFRPVGAGERRVLGMFTAVDCQAGSSVLVIEAEGETIRMAAADLAKVTFLSYRPTAPAGVNCGPIAPVRVFATFAEDDALTASGVAGRAIAIELLPDDFTPQ
jgi:tetratricopeptide (TPR) repeat protein